MVILENLTLRIEQYPDSRIQLLIYFSLSPFLAIYLQTIFFHPHKKEKGI